MGMRWNLLFLAILSLLLPCVTGEFERVLTTSVQPLTMRVPVSVSSDPTIDQNRIYWLVIGGGGTAEQKLSESECRELGTVPNTVMVGGPYPSAVFVGRGFSVTLPPNPSRRGRCFGWGKKEGSLTEPIFNLPLTGTRYIYMTDRPLAALTRGEGGLLVCSIQCGGLCLVSWVITGATVTLSATGPDRECKCSQSIGTVPGPTQVDRQGTERFQVVVTQPTGTAHCHITFPCLNDELNGCTYILSTNLHG
ncbi:hypothetical protein [Eastern grey kangaroopox virus]|uniref:Uncharacterized protein n=1 Tax=Eastern grey kangaroopox virus TaxID=2042482 RepID=A0A2C9DTC5_9POXV|nr:hypothetical protein KM541_gp162 [Eastern grey kangaroopox virus]ATI21258.1 hypothetical protein [Eastern grey kangaroopox virus]ATX75164.1 hypothetical protein EKPV-NSW-ORF182 [Eastern grey kangaroopox virus]